MDAFLLLAQAAEQAAAPAADPTLWESCRDWYVELHNWVPLSFTLSLLAVGLWMLLPSINKFPRLLGAVLPAVVLGIFLWREEIPQGMPLAFVALGLAAGMFCAVLPTGKWGQLVGAVLPALLVGLVLWYEEFSDWVPLAVAPLAMAIGMWLVVLPMDFPKRLLREVIGAALIAVAVGLFLGFETLPSTLRLAIATISLAAGMWLSVPPSLLIQRLVGAASVSVAVILFLKQAPVLEGVVAPGLFWVLAAIAVASAVAAISAKDPVYCALWFALCLLGVAGLFLYQGALFLGIATVAVYAGAIVVTFLFVLMLAQPEGHAFYDRMGWGRVSSGVACLATAALVGVLVYSYSELNTRPMEDVRLVLSRQSNADGEPLIAPENLRRVELHPATDQIELVFSGEPLTDYEAAQVQGALAKQFKTNEQSWAIELTYLSPENDVLAANHVAHLGDQLFGPYLIGVEIAGALLLAALVGAVAIATRGEESRTKTDIEQEGAAA